ncbi:MAG TPA: hypothetical protein IAA75_00775 [Candidatus Pullichristensenella avicola]|nr:hypothetical protein [Candidatus Pullichristensenella avicola]
MIKINNVEIAAPSAIEVELIEETSSAETNLQGRTVMDFFGARRTLTLSWAHMTEAAMNALLTAMGTGFFTVLYPDVDGSDRQITCRCGKRRATAQMTRGGRPVWTDVEMEWIEQ